MSSNEIEKYFNSEIEKLNISNKVNYSKNDEKDSESAEA